MCNFTILVYLPCTYLKFNYYWRCLNLNDVNDYILFSILRFNILMNGVDLVCDTLLDFFDSNN